MNASKAAAVLLPEEFALAAVESALLLVVVEVVLLLDELLELIDANAANIAPRKPPIGGGEGGTSVPALESLVLLAVLEPEALLRSA